ncbi:hypothetical protein GGX14DRAFT_409218 [Mycena pura]|uniref:Uncharacterized protein n=1 Tax=Mycena pura TaxID=153505 RepID=A0AAD6UP27_9AGAR|nr:hypothetical protein GGX14DRAFT_409218 [Mycena pura]
MSGFSRQTLQGGSAQPHSGLDSSTASLLGCLFCLPPVSSFVRFCLSATLRVHVPSDVDLPNAPNARPPCLLSWSPVLLHLPPLHTPSKHRAVSAVSTSPQPVVTPPWTAPPGSRHPLARDRCPTRLWRVHPPPSSQVSSEFNDVLPAMSPLLRSNGPRNGGVPQGTVGGDTVPLFWSAIGARASFSPTVGWSFARASVWAAEALPVSGT